MKISVFGIGRTGAVTSACLAGSGHRVVAVDPSQVKVDRINAARSPIMEKGLDELIGKSIQKGNLRATAHYKDALDSEILFICVGTRNKKDGAHSYKYIKQISRQIGEALQEKNHVPVIVLRKNLGPGAFINTVKPILEKYSGKTAERGFGLGLNPAFLRKNSAVHDFFNPARIIVRALSRPTAEKIIRLYENINVTQSLTEVNVSENLKCVSSVWRADKAF